MAEGGVWSRCIRHTNMPSEKDVFSIFSVVASYSNLSTYRFSEAKKCKPNAEQNELFIFYAEVQPIFAFGGKDKKEILYLRYR